MCGERRQSLGFVSAVGQSIELRKMLRRLHAEDVLPLVAVDLAEEVVLHGPRARSQVAAQPDAVGFGGLDVPSRSLGSQQIDPREVVVLEERVRVAREQVLTVVQRGELAVREERGRLAGLVVEEELVGEREQRGGGQEEEGGQRSGENRRRLGERDGVRKECRRADGNELGIGDDRRAYLIANELRTAGERGDRFCEQRRGESPGVFNALRAALLHEVVALGLRRADAENGGFIVLLR